MKLAGINLPGALTVAENVTVDFSVIDGRVHHSGLALIPAPKVIGRSRLFPVARLGWTRLLT